MIAISCVFYDFGHTFKKKMVAGARGEIIDRKFSLSSR